ncbi:ribosome biogenesis protein BOP1 homolog, partial [Striga asiatica]
MLSECYSLGSNNITLKYRGTFTIGNTYGIDGKFVVVDRPEKVGLNLMISLRKILNCTPCGMIAALGKDGLAHIAAPNPKFPCHEESYNPSPEYIPTAEEINSYKFMFEEDRP